jgi:hypothetical protein
MSRAFAAAVPKKLKNDMLLGYKFILFDILAT